MTELDTTSSPMSNPYGELPRERRQGLTRALLARAARATGAQRKDCLDQVVMVNMPVAQSIAARYRRRGVATDDLEQVAYAALVRVVQNFDVDRDQDLLSYAVPSIRGELRRYFRDHGWTVRPPRRVQELQTRVLEARDRLTATQRNPSAHRIADALDVAEEDVTEALAAQGCFTPTSLDAAVGGADGATLGDLLPDREDDGAQGAAEARVLLQPVLRDLPAKDRKLLRMRFVEDLTQQEIAERNGVTQTQVSRVLNRILGDLRRGIGETSEPDEVAPAGGWGTDAD